MLRVSGVSLVYEKKTILGIGSFYCPSVINTTDAVTERNIDALHESIITKN